MNASNPDAQIEDDHRAHRRAFAGLAVGSVSGDAGDGAVVGGTLDALEGGLAQTDHDPATSPCKIVDRCMKNSSYEILSDLGKVS